VWWSRPPLKEAESAGETSVFKRVLIANRGEIAIRIARAARVWASSPSASTRRRLAGAAHATSSQTRAIGAPGADPVAAYRTRTCRRR